MTLTIIYISLYLIALAAIFFLASRRETSGEYINSGKNLSTIESTFTTFASLLTGYNFVVGITFAFMFGFWYLMVFVGAGLAFVVLYFLYKKQLVNLQSDHNLLSIGDYFGLKYGRFTEISVNLITLASLLLFLTLQLFVNTSLFSGLLGISQISALLLTVGVVCIYLWFGGFKASIKTDIFQGLLMLPIILTIFIFPFNFTVAKIPTALDPSMFWFAVGLALLQFFSLLGQAESFQRIFAVKNSKTLKKSLTIAFVMLAIVAGSIAYLGINFKFSGVAFDPNNLFVGGVLPALPNWLSSLLTVSLIAAFMGTIDSSAFAFGAVATKIKENNRKENNRDEKNTVKWIKIFMLGGIVISATASIYLFSFLSSVFALISIISVIGSAVVVSLIFKLNANQLNIFLSTGFIVFILGLIFKFVTDNCLTAIIPSATAFIVVLLTIFYQKIITKKLPNKTNQ